MGTQRRGVEKGKRRRPKLHKRKRRQEETLPEEVPLEDDEFLEMDGEGEEDDFGDLLEAGEELVDDEDDEDDDGFLLGDDFEEEDDGTEELAGRNLRPITTKELMADHLEETGSRSLFSDEDMIAPNERAARSVKKMDKQQQRERAAKREADSLAPEWLKRSQGAGRVETPPQEGVSPVEPGRTGALVSPDASIDSHDVASAIQILDSQAIRASNAGNYAMAKELRLALDKITASSEVKILHKARDAHPVFNRLQATLGLAKIESAIVEWANLKWHLSASPPMLDIWLADNMWEDDRRNVFALKVCTSCVGINDTPLYDVFSIPLERDYEVTVGNDTSSIKTQPYVKTCDVCGADVGIRDEECTNCGAALSPYEMPAPLRMHCVQRLYQFFMQEFGPFEKLSTLVDLIGAAMKDRMLDSQELYPLGELSGKPQTTPDSQPGEKSSPEPDLSQQTPEQ